MSATRTGRRGFLAAPLALTAALLPGCMPPTPPEQPSGPQAPAPLPVLGSIAAFGTVQAVDMQSRQVLVRMAGGSLLDVTPPEDYRGFGSLRPGTRVVVEYDAQGNGTIAPAPSRAAIARSQRVRATVREIQRGGHHIDLQSTRGENMIFEVPDRAMMAFATRLRPGDQVAVTIQGQ